MPRPIALTCYAALMTGLSAFLPPYLAKRATSGKEDSKRLGERYGRYQAPIPQAGTRIWLHGVSVGEAGAVLALGKSLVSHFDDAHLIITTSTSTSAAIIAKAAKALSAEGIKITHRYAPFDAPRFVRRFFDQHKPDFGIIFESDFWPMMMSMAHDRAIPLFLASAQMSDKSAAKWAKRPALAKAVFAPITACFTHDDKQAAIFTSFGVRQVTVTGSLKLPEHHAETTALARALIEASKGRPLILGASTQEGEEPQLLAISAALHERGTNHLLVIAPRHPARGDAIAAMMPEAKRRSQGALPAKSDSQFLCDSLGDMPSLYQAADVVYLGATFTPKGGHNPIEAASYGKPVICGHSQFKNRYEFDQLKELGVCYQVDNADEALARIIKLIDDKPAQQDVAKAGMSYAKHAAGRAAKVAEAIAQIIQETQS